MEIRWNMQGIVGKIMEEWKWIWMEMKTDGKKNWKIICFIICKDFLMESTQVKYISNPILGDEFKSHLSKYQPKKSYTIDYKILSGLTEYRDYKFANGFYYLNVQDNKIFQLIYFSDNY